MTHLKDRETISLPSDSELRIKSFDGLNLGGNDERGDQTGRHIGQRVVLQNEEERSARTSSRKTIFADVELLHVRRDAFRRGAPALPSPVNSCTDIPASSAISCSANVPCSST